MQPLPPATLTSGTATKSSLPESMLLIGDKVVNASPDSAEYPHQLDLGEEWKRLTGLPFVFAMWMIRQDRAAAEGTGIADLLTVARRRGAAMTEQLLDRHVAEKRWPRDLARRYFTEYLRYEVTPAARRGLARFFELLAKHKLLAISRPIQYLEPRQ
jgi:chorismate dehydratase